MHSYFRFSLNESDLSQGLNVSFSTRDLLPLAASHLGKEVPLRKNYFRGRGLRSFEATSAGQLIIASDSAIESHSVQLFITAE
ncbi:hypothetical protein CDAR_622451 [Caerostris darwini]|uniref:Uncharacterized protein n=1 Tax=Caerostris darwini TaxID=1538125 RepID=A0AAV4SQI3_9ARAC|nr:hypothetical protein CDAR_531761 [Caerostris darwini]GIY43886.1 hypothetical protein CDAR_622451 [Caerostris darwini]